MTLPDFRNPDDLIGNVGTVGEFWRWAMSDLLGNRNRGILAEYLVGRSLLGVLTEPRMEQECWDARTNKTVREKRRYAHLYIFCVFPRDPSDPTRDVLDLSKWNFYVTTTQNLETHLQPEATSIGLTMIQHICGDPVAYGELKGRVDHLLFGVE